MSANKTLAGALKYIYTASNLDALNADIERRAKEIEPCLESSYEFGIGVDFASVGQYLSKAIENFAENAETPASQTQ